MKTELDETVLSELFSELTPAPRVRAHVGEPQLSRRFARGGFRQLVPRRLSAVLMVATAVTASASALALTSALTHPHAPWQAAKPVTSPATVHPSSGPTQPSILASPSGPPTAQASANPHNTAPATATPALSPTPSPTPPVSQPVQPNAGNTGVPAGTSLHAWNGDYVVTTANSTVQNLDIHNGTLVINANNVTVRGVRITDAYPADSGAQICVQINPANIGTVIEDTEISGCATGIAYANYSALRINIHGCVELARINGNVTWQDSYLHDPIVSTGNLTALQMTEGANVVIRHNTIIMPKTSNSFGALLIQQNQGPSSKVVIDNNWLDGSSYTVAVNARSVSITNNRFGRNYVYGVGNVQSTVTESGNVWDDTGQPVAV